MHWLMTKRARPMMFFRASGGRVHSGSVAAERKSAHTLRLWDSGSSITEMLGSQFSLSA